MKERVKIWQSLCDYDEGLSNANGQSKLFYSWMAIMIYLL